MIKGEEYNVAADIERLKEIWEDDGFGPSTGSLIEEAERRDIPLVQLGYGKFQKRIEATIASTTSNIAIDLAGDKAATKRILESVQVPVPKGEIVSDEFELAEAIEEMAYPVVVKPQDGNQGEGATVNINHIDDAITALKIAQQFSQAVFYERYIAGDDIALC